MKKTSLRHLLSTYRLDQLYLPAAFWVLFAIVSLIRLNPKDVLDTSPRLSGRRRPADRRHHGRLRHFG